MTYPQSTPSDNAIRYAVAAMFFANGFVMGHWAVQIPLLMQRFGIGETRLGTLILIMGIGALAAMLVSGRLITIFGSFMVMRVSALLLPLAFAAVASVPDKMTAIFVILIFGAVVGLMDIAMNANAVGVERRLNRAIMSSTHGFWSLGGFVGAASGGWVAEAFGHTIHGLIVSALTLLLVLVTLSYCLRDCPQKTHGAKRKFQLPRSALTYLLGLLALCMMIPEGAMIDWAAVYLRQELGADTASAALAYGIFAAAMAVMRFLGDGIRQKFGAVRTLRVTGIIAASGFLISAFAPSVPVAIAGFALSGFSMANLVPIIFSAAGNQPGMSSGDGLATVTAFGYAGLLLAPFIIGAAGEHIGFSPIFIILAGGLVLVSLLAEVGSHADFVEHRER
ncbi:MFS transporter [Limoniibacter endophyticus]|uniref:MFS transporter n=1 Tax=Limoniibacter endophyticus TaxID=1565040 RepID=A0A8J3DPK1_9HYPH|nr:MFS transporter [Limoniibacter endophyticus]GHC77234.1 MFS transporter [Limoniibacter endophyticus]